MAGNRPAARRARHDALSEPEKQASAVDKACVKSQF